MVADVAELVADVKDEGAATMVVLFPAEVASGFPKPEAVNVRCRTGFVDNYQLMFRAVECSLACIGFVPHAKVFEFCKYV